MKSNYPSRCCSINRGIDNGLYLDHVVVEVAWECLQVGIMEDVISNALHSRGYPLLAEVRGRGQ